MKGYPLHHHSIFPKGLVHRNPSADWLVHQSLKKKETIKAKNGALIVYTGKYTGRSPKDKFIVDSPSIHEKIDWNSTNRPISKVNFYTLYRKISKYLSNKDELFVFDGFVGADTSWRLHVRVVSEYAYQTLFSRHLLRRPTADELRAHIPQLTILSAPNCFANPKTDGTNSEVFIIINIEKMIILIGGTKYSGEIKKSIFSVMNILLPEKKVLPMHCSANISYDGKTALFFGLSGTGKTTLSADPKRRLIGDDEHGWSKDGIFNFEGGCYAKCIHLNKKHEPQIWNAIRHQSLLENVIVKPNGELDYDDKTITENTRVVYPIEFIENTVLSGKGGHPSYIIFLTADAFGVLPPVAKLSMYGALYHFLSGYTSKLAGTERGIIEPSATFSAFFGGPFMALKPTAYISLLKYYLKKYKTQVYLVNTGWSGGPYGIGKRISIQDTRFIVSAILEGKLDCLKYRHDGIFNLDVPLSVPHVKTAILAPRNLWRDKKAYDEKTKHLALLFQKNFMKFSNIPKQVIHAGPYI